MTEEKVKAKRMPGPGYRRYGTNWGIVNSKGEWGHDSVGNILAWRLKRMVDEFIDGANHGGRTLENTVWESVVEEGGRLIDTRR